MTTSQPPWVLKIDPVPVGAGLPAMAACQPTNLFQMHPEHCRSELAREKRPDNAIIQAGHVIVDVHREQARSYRDFRWVSEACLKAVGVSS
ncbi:hypothetical protein D3C87_1661850 [compost metagenome]